MTSANSTAKETALRVKTFETLAPSAAQPAWLAALRQTGLNHFAAQGFPTLQQEDWRFTNVSPIAQLPFHPVTQLAPTGLTSASLKTLTFASLAAHRLVFVNGIFAPELSTPASLPAGVRVSNLVAALQTDAALIEKHLGKYANTAGNAFTALNTAFFQDGTFIHVPAGTVVETPIHLLHLFTATETGATAHPRNLIIVGDNAQVTILETFAATVDTPYFTNAVTELVAGDNAAVEHLKFQDEAITAFHMAAFHAHLGKTSNVIHHSIAAGAKLSRNNIRTNLAGEGLECVLNGLYLTRGEQLADHYMVVEHAQPHCASHEYFNGILDDKSRGVFHGRILVQPVAQKTDAKQTNKNLLLSDHATADTKPQLEIYADDVKCTHGATIGQLNAESIYYLRSRGIGKETARRMLIHAFAGEIIERVRHEAARTELDQVVWNRLEANPHLGTN